MNSFPSITSEGLKINRVQGKSLKPPKGLGLTVFLKNRGNPDFRQDENRKLPDTVSDIYAVVSSIQEAQLLCRAYVEFYDLGGGNFYDSKVFDNDGNHIANISYNGRVWDARTEAEVII